MTLLCCLCSVHTPFLLSIPFHQIRLVGGHQCSGFFLKQKHVACMKGAAHSDRGDLFSWEHFSWAVPVSANRDQLIWQASCHRASSKRKLSLNDVFSLLEGYKNKMERKLANLKIQEASTHPLNLKSGTSDFLSAQYVFQKGQCTCNMFLARNALLPQFFFQVWIFFPLRYHQGYQSGFLFLFRADLGNQTLKGKGVDLSVALNGLPASFV